MTAQPLNGTRRFRETGPQRVARLWKHQRTTFVRSRIWLVAAIVLVAIVPLVLMGILLGGAAQDVFQAYVDRLMSLLQP